MDPRMVSLRGVGSPSSRPSVTTGETLQTIVCFSTPVCDISRNARLFDENVTVMLADAAFYPVVQMEKMINGYLILMETALASWPLLTLSFMTFDPRLLKHGLLIYGEYGKRFVLTAFIRLANLTL
jgi:hypothetical protein